MEEQRQSTQRMRMDLANTLRPELKLSDAAFTCYGLHYVYQLVESIIRVLNMVQLRKYCQRMRMELANTQRPELDL